MKIFVLSYSVEESIWMHLSRNQKLKWTNIINEYLLVLSQCSKSYFSLLTTTKTRRCSGFSIWSIWRKKLSKIKSFKYNNLHRFIVDLLLSKIYFFVLSMSPMLWILIKILLWIKMVENHFEKQYISPYKMYRDGIQQ